MNCELDTNLPLENQSNAEFEEYLDELNSLTPDRAEAERVYWQRRRGERDRKMAEMEEF